MEETRNIEVLIIDDDIVLHKLLKDFLSGYQMNVIATASPLDSIEILQKKQFDIIILDIQMPQMNGLMLCTRIRKFIKTPIIMLSARGNSSDKILGLELGADDYLSKPFNPRELVSRINSILRRYKIEEDNGAHSKDLLINKKTRNVKLNNVDISLTSMEFDLLLLLSENAGTAISRNEIQNALQGTESSFYSRSVDILVSRLRSKLGETARNAKYIKSIHGFGYLFPEL